MKVIFVNRFYWPDHSATAQILSDLAEHLAGLGHEIQIITSRQLLEQPKAKLTAREQHRKVTIHRVRTSTFGRNNLVGRAVDYLSFYVAAFIKGLQVIDANTTVVCKTDPPLIGLAFYPVTQLKKARLVNWWQDIYPEIAARSGIVSERSWIYRGVRAARNQLAHRSAANVVIGESMRAFFASEVTTAQRLEVIPNWSADLGGAPSVNRYRQELGIVDHTVIGYSGNLGRAHDLSKILELSKLWAAQPKISFLLIGGGFHHSKLKEEIKALGLNNWHFLNYQDRKNLPESLSAIDIHVVSLRPELNGLIIPSKIYGVLSARRPTLFIGSQNQDFQELCEKGCGIVWQQEDTINDQELLQLSDLISRREQAGLAARAVFEQRYTQNECFDAWNALLISRP